MLIVTRRALALAALGAAALAATAAPAAAQLGGVNPFSVGVSGGAAIPVGDFGDFAKTGYSVDGIVAVRFPASPISLRGEVGYTRFDLKDSAFEDEDSGGLRGNFRTISGVANVVLTVPAGPAVMVRPYLIGGVGVYNSRTGVSGGGVTVNGASQNRLGFNGGVGLEIPLSGITGLGEVRFVNVRTKEDNDAVDAIPFNANHVAVRFGIRF